MTAWTPDDLDRIGTGSELGIAPRRPDGSLHRRATVWAVRVGDDVYVRSWRGAAGRWYDRVLATHAGRVATGGLERDVAIVESPEVDRAAVDAAYVAKYGRNGYVDRMTGDDAAATTLRLLPA